MRLKIYKPMLLALTVMVACYQAGMAQTTKSRSNSSVTVSASFDDKDFKVNMEEFSRNLKQGLKELGKNISVTINDVAPKFTMNFDKLDIDPNISIDLGDMGDNMNFNTADNDDDGNGGASVKIKNYTKTYPLDANDQIKLSNQYGKITVNTWDRHEVKVDVQIKAEAESDDYAQKLLDGVQINDTKSGDQVSFRTQIERSNNSSWKIWNWGGDNKRHKITINYTVYMPSKNDLSVEESYGSLQLPDLSGKIKISASYGSVVAENLSNPANDIEGSYGSLKIASLNGGKLEYAYGSAEIQECNNLKADLAYGSFKMGKLKGTAEFNVAYVGGFRIGEVATTFKKLNIDASYSGVTLGVPNNNFDFDISTAYGGFNYDDDKVTFTSKTPPDGSKHIGTSRNYKGHVGKGGSDAQVNIHTSYGSVHFE